MSVPEESHQKYNNTHNINDKNIYINFVKLLIQNKCSALIN